MNSTSTAAAAWLPALAATVAVTWYLAARVSGASDGQLLYVLDDAHIHLSMARSLAEGGVWGPSTEGFVPASSAPLFTALLGALMWLLGPCEALPRAVELCAAAGFLWLGGRFLGRHLRGLAVGGVLTAAALLVPLPLLVLLGMEHGLHAWVSLALLLACGRLLAGSSLGISTLVLAAVAAGLRYESCALIGLVVLGLLVKGRVGAAAGLAGAGALIPAIMGGVSWSKGWFLAPTGLVTKAALMWPQAGPIERWWINLDGNLSDAPALGGVVALGGSLLLLWRWRRQDWGGREALLWVVRVLIGMVVIHLIFGKVGWYYRYEAYLYALALVVLPAAVGSVIGPLWRGGRGPRVSAVALVVIAAWTVFHAGQRARFALAGVPGLARDLHTQNNWTARFFSEALPGERIATHDLGLVSWHTRRVPLDLAGLASREIATLYLEGRRQPAIVDRLAREGRVHVAWTFRNWFDQAGFGAAPVGWVPVATLRTQNHSRQLAGDSFTFWALDPDAALRLEEALRARAARLPRRVAVEWAPPSWR